jgi:hypothetical protein
LEQPSLVQQEEERERRAAVGRRAAQSSPISNVSTVPVIAPTTKVTAATLRPALGEPERDGVAALQPEVVGERMIAGKPTLMHARMM